MKAIPISVNVSLQTGTEQRPDESVINSFSIDLSSFVLRGSQGTPLWSEGRN